MRILKITEGGSLVGVRMGPIEIMRDHVDRDGYRIRGIGHTEISIPEVASVREIRDLTASLLEMTERS